MVKKWIFIAVLAIGAFAIYEAWDRDVPQAERMTVSFEGVNLNCSGCQEKMESALSKILGIKEVQMLPARDVVKITFATKVMRAEWIARSLKAAGFKPEDYSLAPASAPPAT